MKTNEELLQEILGKLDQISYIKGEKIPNIDLYMDQVTTFMEENLRKMKRNPEDKALTKTMINNYAKNNLIPSPIKKKYSKEHMILLLFIYYYKNLLSFNDIEQLFKPLTENHFAPDSETPLVSIYEEICSLEKEQMDCLKEDLVTKFEHSKTTFSEVEEENREYLQLFAFVSEVAFDIYLKKQMIEAIIDQMKSEK